MIIHKLPYVTYFYDEIYKLYENSELTDNELKKYSDGPKMWDLDREVYSIQTRAAVKVPITDGTFIGLSNAKPRVFYRIWCDIKASNNKTHTLEVDDKLFVRSFNYLNIRYPAELEKKYLLTPDIRAQILYQLYLEKRCSNFLKLNPELIVFNTVNNTVKGMAEIIHEDSEPPPLFETEISGLNYSSNLEQDDPSIVAIKKSTSEKIENSYQNLRVVEWPHTPIIGEEDSIVHSVKQIRAIEIQKASANALALEDTRLQILELTKIFLNKIHERKFDDAFSLCKKGPAIPNVEYLINFFMHSISLENIRIISIECNSPKLGKSFVCFDHSYKRIQIPMLMDAHHLKLSQVDLLAKMITELTQRLKIYYPDINIDNIPLNKIFSWDFGNYIFEDYFEDIVNQKNKPARELDNVIGWEVGGGKYRFCRILFEKIDKKLYVYGIKFATYHGKGY